MPSVTWRYSSQGIGPMLRYSKGGQPIQTVHLPLQILRPDFCGVHHHQGSGQEAVVLNQGGR